MNETVVTVTGYVAQEPVLRLTGSGTKVVGFRLATTERRYDRGLNGWRDGDTLFFPVSCWRTLGENVLDSVRKGDPVVVQGRLRDGTYEKDGVTYPRVEIEATSVGHDLARGVSRFTKSSLQSRETFVDAPVAALGSTGVDDDPGTADLDGADEGAAAHTAA